ncbi:LysM peptidoglycan-binding domain-containing protein [Hymenobacter ginkgonis]|nr:lytic transglycosylase domain-containing protein [Hymenobacter ginkgonis]
MRKLLPTLLLGLAGRSALATAPPTVPAALDAIGLHLTLDEEARQLVQAKVNSLCRHTASLEARVALAEAAFPLIDRVLAEEGVPSDFRYLVLQESALQGNAESNHGAVGYWQLKRETALSLGLTVDGQVDERRHLVASTRAAARYLTRNNASLHNWANALLSYNLGLGGVRSYTTPADADATQLVVTARTSSYILDFLAQKVVFEPACAQHAVPFVPWREVPAAPGQSLAQQAATFATDPDALAQLNPWLLANKVPQDGHSYTLLVPLGGPTPPLAASPVPVTAPVASTAAFSYVNGIKALLARPGDTPTLLAARGGASLGFFLKVNELEAGEVLVPGEPYFFQRKRETAAQDYHVVAAGQTLAAVARHYGVLRHALRAYNHLDPDETVQPGLVLWLSHQRPRSLAPEYQPLPEARPAIARRTPTPAPAPTPPPAPAISEDDAELLAINNLPTEIPGPPVIPLPTPRAVLAPTPPPAAKPVAVAPVAVPPVPVAVAHPVLPPRPATTSTNPYLVAPGETLYALARRVGVRPAELADWNNLPPDAALRAGQMLRLSPPASVPTPPVASTPGAYVVAAGDTFFSISRRYGCTVAELLAHNGKDEPILRVGETLRVPRL